MTDLSSLFDKLKDNFFEKRRVVIQKTYQRFLEFMDGKEPGDQDAKTLKHMEQTLTSRYHYCRHCTTEAMAFLLKNRYD